MKKMELFVTRGMITMNSSNTCQTISKHTTEKTAVPREGDVPDVYNIFQHHIGTTFVTKVASEGDVPDRSQPEFSYSKSTTMLTNVEGETDVPDVQQSLLYENCFEEIPLIKVNDDGKSFFEKLLEK